MAYTFSTVIRGPFDDVVDRVESALADEGFGVLSKIDVRATLKAKLGFELEPYVILGACNPPLAKRAVTSEPSIGALLPCNVVVRGGDDNTIVEFMDPAAVLGLVDSADIEDIAAEVRSKLQKVKNALVS